MNYAEESQQAGRHLMPDLVRSFAIIGIALVNVGAIAYSLEFNYFDGGYRTGADHWTSFLVNAVAMVKTYTLFAFMFGVGFAYQMKSAERAGASFKARYFRRILGLFVLGFLHFILAFPGDILVMYALFGIILYLFKNTTVKNLVITGILLFAVQIAIMGLSALAIHAGFAFAPEVMATEAQNMQDIVDRTNIVISEGTFLDAVKLRLSLWPSYTGAGFFLQGGGIIGAFLFGLAAVKSDLIANPSAKLWGTFRKIFLPIGIIGSIIGAYIYMGADEMFSVKAFWGLAILFAFAPFSSAGYLGLIAKWASGPMTGFKTFMARGGTATLTSYLMQSLILSLIFSNYGLGYYAKLGAATCIAIALGVAIFTLVFSSLWRTKFKRGPMEALLRGFTYMGNR